MASKYCKKFELAMGKIVIEIASDEKWSEPMNDTLSLEHLRTTVRTAFILIIGMSKRLGSRTIPHQISPGKLLEHINVDPGLEWHSKSVGIFSICYDDQNDGFYYNFVSNDDKVCCRGYLPEIIRISEEGIIELSFPIAELIGKFC